MKYCFLVIFFTTVSAYSALTSDELAQSNERDWVAAHAPQIKPADLVTSENQFIALCNATFADNDNQKRTIVEFTEQAEAMKTVAMSVITTNSTQGLLDMMAASELIHRATGALLDVKNQAARWGACPYDTNAAWDYIEYHP